jgi:hypothetical protein
MNKFYSNYYLDRIYKIIRIIVSLIHYSDERNET